MEINGLIGNRYSIEEKIGAGSFGKIYRGHDITTKEKVAIKLEPGKCKFPQVIYEARLLWFLQGGEGLPQVYWYGSEYDYNIMVMTLLGPSLEDIFNFWNRRFSMKTALLIGQQMLERMAGLHKSNFIHRDVKPDNFLIHHNRKIKMLYLIDFGLTKRYRDSKTKQHIPYREGKSLTGTARYASVNWHLGWEVSRRDDLESVGYLLLYFLRGNLPWQGLQNPDAVDRYHRIKEVKMGTSAEVLVTGFPEQLAEYFNYVKSLRFEQDPDMEYLKEILNKVMRVEQIIDDSIYDWNLLNYGARPTAVQPLRLPGARWASGERKVLRHSSHNGLRRRKVGETFSNRPASPKKNMGGWMKKGSVVLPHKLDKHRDTRHSTNPGNRTMKSKRSKTETFNVVINNECETAELSHPTKTMQDTKFIDSVIWQKFLFGNLSARIRRSLWDHFIHAKLNKGDIVYTEGLVGVNFYVIAKGCVKQATGKKVLGKMTKGESFGEIALIDKAPRSNTTTATETTELWALSYNTFQSTLKRVNRTYHSENLNFINSVPLFNKLTQKEKGDLVNCLNVMEFKDGSRIISEGETGDLFYIVKEGQVQCMQGSQDIRKMQKGEFFGEQALIYDCARSATVIAFGDATWLTLSRDNLTKILGGNLEQIIYNNTMRMIIEQSPHLNVLLSSQTDKIIKTMGIKNFQPGEVIVEAGTPLGKLMFMVVKGKVQGYEGFTVIGDEAFAKPTTWTFSEDLVAEQESAVGCISIEQFESCIGGPLSSIEQWNKVIVVLQNVPFLRNLAPRNLIKISGSIDAVPFSSGDYIVRQGSHDQTFYIIKEGTVDILKDDQVLRTIGKNDYFGEKSILTDEVRSASVVAKEDVVCWALNRDSFVSICDEQVIRQLEIRMALQDDSIELNDLISYKVLGKGQFGSVFLCQHNRKKTMYALKSVHRDKVAMYKISDNLVYERDILLKIDHVMIMKLVKTMKDENRVYFLTEHIHGIDLFDALRQIGLCQDSDSKFYCACLLLALEHLAEKRIVHRDLKPENTMIDEWGYPKVIDFGTAKFVDERTYTIIGTPHYMAPEVVMGRGYGIQVDIWSLGVMLYEFLCGQVPFGEEEKDSYKVYEAVIKGRLSFPGFMGHNFPAKQTINQLLNRNPTQRGTPTDIMENSAWFKGYNFEDLLSKSVRPKFVPKLKPEQIDPSRGSTVQRACEVEELEDQDSKPPMNPSPPGWDVDF